MASPPKTHGLQILLDFFSISVSIIKYLVTVQPSVIASGFCEAIPIVVVIASGFCEAIPIVVGSNHCEAISESAIGDCFGTKNRASQ